MWRRPTPFEGPIECQERQQTTQPRPNTPGSRFAPQRDTRLLRAFRPVIAEQLIQVVQFALIIIDELRAPGLQIDEN